MKGAHGRARKSSDKQRSDAGRYEPTPIEGNAGHQDHGGKPEQPFAVQVETCPIALQR